MSPGVLGVGADICSSSRSCRRDWDPAIPLAERGAHEAPRLALNSLGLLTHARTLSLPALTASPRPAAPVHHGPARSSTWPPPPTFARLAPNRRTFPAHLDPSIPIVGGPGGRRRAASFNAPFSRIALSRDDTKKPSSFSDIAGRGCGFCLGTARTNAPSHLAPILAECVGKVKPEPRRREREFSTSAPGSGRADDRGCLGPRHLLHGDAGECQLLASYLRHRTRRRAFPGARESEMGEDPLNDGRVLDRGDELHPPGAARTA